MDTQNSSVVNGELADGMVVSQAGTNSDLATTIKEETKPIYVGTKAFNSAEELAKYTNELQQKIVEKELVKPVPAMEIANQPKISQLMFEDPDAYTEAVIQDAERRIKEEWNKKETTVKTWSEFYKENPDLEPYRELIDGQYALKRDQYKDLPVQEGLSKIKTEVRGFISKIKGTPQGGKELPSGPAMVAGVSNGNTTTQVAATKVMTFADQLRQRQKKGKG